MKLILPTFKIEKKSETTLGQDLIETNISFPTQFSLHTWNKWIILRMSFLGFGICFTIPLEKD